MAGDWLKIREDLHEDPAVVRIATWMKVRPEVVVGYLVKFWGWVSRNTADGVVANLSPDEIEGVLNLPHFLGFMQRVGWLEFIESESGTQIIIPKFDRHLSNSAKKRAEKTRQKREERARKEDVANVSPTCRQNVGLREEKRREDKNPPTPQGEAPKGSRKYDPLTADLPFASPRFRDSWSDWVSHRREIRKPLTQTSVKSQLKKMREWGESRAVAAMQHTIASGWTGLREPEGAEKRAKTAYTVLKPEDIL